MKLLPPRSRDSSQLQSTSSASLVLVRQYLFPEETDDNLDHFVTYESDHCLLADLDRSQACLQKHTGRGELGLLSWIHQATNENVLAFLIEFTDADANIAWTGYRVMGTVHVMNGSTVLHLQLFAKHPKSKTEVTSWR